MLYVDHGHQLFSSLFVVWQIGQKDFFILDQYGTNVTCSFLSAHLSLMHSKTWTQAEQPRIGFIYMYMFVKSHLLSSSFVMLLYRL